MPPLDPPPARDPAASPAEVSATESASLGSDDAWGDSATTGTSSPTRGATIGRYVILSTLGAGGMGVVHAAHDPELDRRVALKVLRPGAASSEGARLLREARSLARLDHPNVVPVHDVGVAGDQVFVAMELVEGASVKRWLAERPRDLREVLAVFRDAAHGLAAAHRAGIIHRDFKPDNMIRGVDGRVRVLDFGLARPLTRAAPSPPPHDASATPSASASASATPTAPRGPEVADLASRLTRDGAVMGTPAYMAPEQWKGEEATAAADQFSFCVALWEALYGQRPFPGATTPAILRAVLRGEIAPVERPRLRVPAYLRELLTRGLALRPADRFPSMDALLAALARGEARWRRRGLLGGAALLAVAGLTAVGVRAQRVAACDASGPVALAPVWSDAVADDLRAALAATGLSYAHTTFERARARIDAWTGEWSALRTRTCHESRTGARSPDFEALARECLDDQLDALAGLLGVYLAGATDDLEPLVPATASLPRLTACVERDALARRLRLPQGLVARTQVRALRHQLNQVRGLAFARHEEEVVARAEAILGLAESLGHRPVVAEAELLVGEIASLTDNERAAEVMQRAFADGGAIGADAIAGAAAVDLVGLVDAKSPALAPRWLAPASMFVRRLGEEEGLLGARLTANQARLDGDRGDLARAIAGHRRALDLYSRLLGRDHPKVAGILIRLANLQRDLGDRDAALAAITEALALRETSLGHDHPAIAVTRNDLALIHQAQGRYAEALAEFERALALMRGAYGPESLQAASIENNLGRLHHLRGDLDAADRHLGHALAVRESQLPADDLDLAVTLHNLGLLDLLRGERLRARDRLERALAIRESQLPPTNAEILGLLDSLGTLYYRIGDLERALATHRRALDLQREKLGQSHLLVAHSLRNLALVQRLLGEPDDAIQLASDALALAEAGLRPDHPDVATFLNTLGAVLRRRDPAAAEAHLTRALSIARAARGDRHPATATSRLRLAEVLAQRGDAARARPHLDEALAIRESVSKDSPEVAEVLVALALLDLADGHPADAVPRSERALHLRDRDGVPAYERAEARFALARALAAAAPARRLADRPHHLAAEAAALYRGAGPGFHADLAAVEAWLHRP